MAGTEYDGGTLQSAESPERNVPRLVGCIEFPSGSVYEPPWQHYVRCSYIHDGNPVHGWEYTVEEEDALWRFEWLSVTTIDIGRALSNNAHKLEGIEPFEEHDIYFVLRRDLLRDIWRSSDLATTPYRPGVFDHDAFALGRCRAFGVVVEKQMGFAFNWTLSADLSDIIFIDPANGRTIGRDLFKSAPTLAAAAQGKFEDDNLTGFF
ncbi:hypothetical protein C8J57DRAFT_1241391 [Mycena rebaudengoi]|nr:hypothetical protein C8J57DRAFT_1241391 [Mycena rebaudengoi]